MYFIKQNLLDIVAISKTALPSRFKYIHMYTCMNTQNKMRNRTPNGLFMTDPKKSSLEHHNNSSSYKEEDYIKKLHKMIYQREKELEEVQKTLEIKDLINEYEQKITNLENSLVIAKHQLSEKQNSILRLQETCDRLNHDNQKLKDKIAFLSSPNLNPYQVNSKLRIQVPRVKDRMFQGPFQEQIPITPTRSLKDQKASSLPRRKLHLVTSHSLDGYEEEVEWSPQINNPPNLYIKSVAKSQQLVQNKADVQIQSKQYIKHSIDEQNTYLLAKLKQNSEELNLAKQALNKLEQQLGIISQGLIEQETKNEQLEQDKKLLRTQVMEMIAELREKDQMCKESESLSNQYEKRIKKISSEHSGLTKQISRISEQLRGRLKELQEVREKLQLSELQCLTLQSQRATREKRIEWLESERLSHESLRTRLQQEILRLESEKFQLKSTVQKSSIELKRSEQKYQNEILFLKAEIESLVKSRQSLSRQIILTKDEDINTLREEIEKLENEIWELRIKSRGSDEGESKQENQDRIKIRELSINISQLEQKCRQSKLQIDKKSLEHEDELTRLKQQHNQETDRLRTTILNLDKQVEELQHECRRIEESAANLESKLTQDLKSSKEAISDYTSKMRQKERELYRLEVKAKELEREVSLLRSAEKTLKQQNIQLQAQLHELQHKQMEAKNREISNEQTLIKKKQALLLSCQELQNLIKGFPDLENEIHECLNETAVYFTLMTHLIKYLIRVSENKQLDERNTALSILQNLCNNIDDECMKSFLEDLRLLLSQLIKSAREHPDISIISGRHTMKSMKRLFDMEISKINPIQMSKVIKELEFVSTQHMPGGTEPLPDDGINQQDIRKNEEKLFEGLAVEIVSDGEEQAEIHQSKGTVDVSEIRQNFEMVKEVNEQLFREIQLKQKMIKELESKRKEMEQSELKAAHLKSNVLNLLKDIKLTEKVTPYVKNIYALLNAP